MGMVYVYQEKLEPMGVEYVSFEWLASYRFQQLPQCKGYPLVQLCP